MVRTFRQNKPHIQTLAKEVPFTVEEDKLISAAGMAVEIILGLVDKDTTSAEFENASSSDREIFEDMDKV